MIANKKDCDILLDNHEKLVDMFYRFKMSIGGNYEKIYELFNEFKWAFEMHVFVEEKMIFTLYHQQNKEDAEMINTLVRQHHKLLELLGTIENDIVNKKRIFVLRFEQLWLTHNRFEDEVIYPKVIDKICVKLDILSNPNGSSDLDLLI